MKVNINNLRLQACNTYNSLVKALNINNETDWDGIKRVKVDADIIEGDLNYLGQLIGTLACCYNDNDPDFIDVMDQVGSLEIFNSEEEESDNE